MPLPPDPDNRNPRPALKQAPTSGEVKALALERLREFETAYLADPVHGRVNPFRRPGLTASEIAYACSLFTDASTRSGRAKADVAAARRLLKELIADGTAESTGRHRTLQAGSQSKECFAPAGFALRLSALRQA